MAGQRSGEGMPQAVRWAVAGVWCHAALNAVNALTLFALIDDSHGDRTAGLALARFVAVLSILVAVLLATCAALASRRAAWTRITVLAIEWVALVAGVASVFSGSPAVAGGILLAVVVLRVFGSAEGRAWFNA
ncbi:hypothetical protein ACWEQL_05025 [Kitasatospora sp. NPDC004240]